MLPSALDFRRTRVIEKMVQQCLTLFHIGSNTNIPLTLQIHSCDRTFPRKLQHYRSRHVGHGKSWEWVLSRLSLIITEKVPSPLICVSRNKWNWFVFREIGLCFGKLVRVLRNWFVFWEIDLCFRKLICDLGNCFVFWEIVLCFGKLFCVLVNWFVIDPFGPPYISDQITMAKEKEYLQHSYNIRSTSFQRDFTKGNAIHRKGTKTGWGREKANDR